MSTEGKCSMERKIVHRSYNCLVLDYADGERVTIRDVERIRWVLTECEKLVRLFVLKQTIFQCVCVYIRNHLKKLTRSKNN